MLDPLVSILLPAHAAAVTLPACLRSIERQSLPRWECVLVDDGSTDGTAVCAAAFARRDTRFKPVSTPHRGLVAALCAGLPLCRAPYVARIDADDLMHCRRLEEQVAMLEADPTLDAVGCHVRLFPRASLGDGYRAYESWLNAVDTPERVEREAFVECPLAHPGLTIRTDLIKTFGYRDRGWPEDYDLLLRLLAAGRRIAVLPRRRLLWRHREERLSRTDPRYATARFTACKASFLADGFLAHTDRYILWGYGGTGRALRRALAAHDKRPSHIVELHPGRLGNVIHDAPVIDPPMLPHVPRLPLLVSVAGAENRGIIRTALAGMGFTELRDYVCAA